MLLVSKINVQLCRYPNTLSYEQIALTKKVNLCEALSCKSISDRITNNTAKTYKKHDELVFMTACLLHSDAFPLLSCPQGRTVKNKFHCTLTLVDARYRNQYTEHGFNLPRAPMDKSRDNCNLLSRIPLRIKKQLCNIYFSSSFLLASVSLFHISAAEELSSKTKRVTVIGGSLRVTFVVDWWFCPEIFCRWWGPMSEGRFYLEVVGTLDHYFA